VLELRGHELIAIGELAKRTGLSVSAIRYYEEQNLVQPERSRGGQRRFLRADIRKLSFVVIVQQMGFSIAQIKKLLADLPEGRAPTKQDWNALSRVIRADLDLRIGMLNRLRERLDGCIGCGCLSLKSCQLYNPDDRAKRLGTGARYIYSEAK
jgi:MerR family transcriptional regulator, redox-sensitive transcriptional activator SoxR